MEKKGGKKRKSSKEEYHDMEDDKLLQQEIIKAEIRPMKPDCVSYVQQYESEEFEDNLWSEEEIVTGLKQVLLQYDARGELMEGVQFLHKVDKFKSVFVHLVLLGDNLDCGNPSPSTDGHQFKVPNTCDHAPTIVEGAYVDTIAEYLNSESVAKKKKLKVTLLDHNVAKNRSINQLTTDKLASDKVAKKGNLCGDLSHSSSQTRNDNSGVQSNSKSHDVPNRLRILKGERDTTVPLAQERRDPSFGRKQGHILLDIPEKDLVSPRGQQLRALNGDGFKSHQSPKNQVRNCQLLKDHVQSCHSPKIHMRNCQSPKNQVQSCHVETNFPKENRNAISGPSPDVLKASNTSQKSPSGGKDKGKGFFDASSSHGNGKMKSIDPEEEELLRDLRIFTGDIRRDYWRAKLLATLRKHCSSEVEMNRRPAFRQGTEQLWTNRVVLVVERLESLAFKSLTGRRYQFKLRSLFHNLENTALLTSRLVKGTLSPELVFTFQPAELKEARKIEQQPIRDVSCSTDLEYVAVLCGQCSEKRAVVKNKFLTTKSNRYQVECENCGNVWHTTPDAMLTVHN